MKEKEVHETKFWLKMVFVYYSSFGDRNNFKLLKQQNYRKFLIDSETVKNAVDFPIFDLLFSKLRMPSITYDCFLELIPDLACNFLSIQKFFFKNCHVKMLLRNIQHLTFDPFTFVSLRKQSLVLTLKEQQSSLLDCSPQFTKIYQQYIQSTQLHQKEQTDTFDKLCIFLKDFQLSPYLLPKSICYLIFIWTMKNSNEPQICRKKDLTSILICISELIHIKQNLNKQCSQMTKIFRLLQRMQLSVGFERLFYKNQSQTSLTKIFLNQSQMFVNQNAFTSLQQNADKTFQSAKRSNKYFSQYSPKENSKKKSIQQQLFQSNQLQPLKQLFQSLCSKGQTSNDKTLKSLKINKMFERIHFESKIHPHELDLIVTNLCRHSKSGKIQFSQFINLINIVAEKMQMNPQRLQKQLLSNQIIKGAVPKKNTPVASINIQSMLSIIQKLLQSLIDYYSKSRGQLNFNELFKLAYQFDIFPSMVSKVRLFQIFGDAVQTKAYRFKQVAKQKQISLQGFKQVLFVISQEISPNGLTAEQKLIILLQRMNQSQGNQKVLLGKSASLVSELRHRYKDVYRSNFTQQIVLPHVATFQQLIREQQIK